MYDKPKSIFTFQNKRRNLQNPNKAAVKVRIDALKVVEGYRLSKELLIERHREAAVEVMSVENRNANYPSNKMKVW